MSTNSIDFHVTIKNYRCFSDQKPVRISMRKGFTALVGVNNSGKSSLLRLFYELRSLFMSISRSGDQFIQAMRADPGLAFNRADSVRDNAELFCNANARDITLEFEATLNLTSEHHNSVSPERIVLTIPRDTNLYRAQMFLAGKVLNIKTDTSMGREGNSALRIGDKLIDMEAYYRIFEALSRVVYIGPFRNAINVGGSADYYDMQIGEHFIRSWDSLKAGGSKKQISAALRLTQDIKTVFRFRNLEINAGSDNRTLQVIIDEKPYGLEELGSGLAQFIVILSNIAAKKPSWVLIDEPELNLHPTLQLDFLTTLASYASEGILFSTQSIGLARTCADRIYSVRLDDEGRSEISDFETTPRLSEFLGELSFSGYRELSCNQILLVEGSTDVKTIQQLLRHINKDHQIVLLSLAGSDLIKAASETELQEIKRITDNIYALIDSERDAPGVPLSTDRQAFLETCHKLDIKCLVLERRAVENYLSDRAVKVAKGEKYRSLKPYENLSDASPSWGKQENWRIAREMTHEELDQTDLGKFLDDL